MTKYCLIVDDSAVVRKVARRILESVNLRVEEAEDGRQALEMCRMEMPDAVFVDANMPHVDGFDFVRDLRTMERGKHPRVLLCATENDVAYVARARHLGADQFLLKPFDKAYLVQRFQDAGVI